MLSTLSDDSRKYAMVCGVQAMQSVEEQKPMTLTEVLSVAKGQKVLSVKPEESWTKVGGERQPKTVTELLQVVASEGLGETLCQRFVLLHLRIVSRRR